jgi:hypothetical protein
MIGTGSITVTGTFEDVIVWGHEAPVDREVDGFVRGVEEWLNVADKVRLPTPPRSIAPQG